MISIFEINFISFRVALVSDRKPRLNLMDKEDGQKSDTSLPDTGRRMKDSQKIELIDLEDKSQKKLKGNKVSFHERYKSNELLLSKDDAMSMTKHKSAMPRSPVTRARASLTKYGPLVVTERNKHIVARW